MKLSFTHMYHYIIILLQFSSLILSDILICNNYFIFHDFYVGVSFSNSNSFRSHFEDILHQFYSKCFTNPNI